MTLPVILPPMTPPPGEMNCSDGRLTVRDIAKAARVNVGTALAAVKAMAAAREFTDGPGRGVVMEATVPPPSETTKADMAKLIAEQLGLGIYRPRPNVTPRPRRERKLSSQTHPYRRGDKGRSIRCLPTGHHLAKLTCGCGGGHEIQFRELAGSDQIDRKFIQAGWTVDPARCPTCARPAKDQTTMTKPSPAAVKAQATMFRLLGEHFDADKGRFADGWDDARIAKDSGAAVEMVAAVRDEAFGTLQEPEEVAALARDLATFDAMVVEAAQTVETLRSELGQMKQRLAEVRRKFAA